MLRKEAAPYKLTGLKNRGDYISSVSQMKRSNCIALGLSDSNVLIKINNLYLYSCSYY